MTVPRLSRRHRHGCRVLGASFVAAAALPLLGVMPLAQATSGHGQASASSHGQVSNHVRAMDREQAGQSQPAKPAAKPAQRQAAKPAAKPAQRQAAKPAAKPAQHQAAKPAAKPAAGHAPAAQKLANVQRQPLKGHGQAKVVVCHATNSDTNPYVVIVVSVASVKYQGHLAHRTTPNKIWKHATTWNGKTYAAGSAKPDLIEGLDGKITVAFCRAHGTTPTPTTSTTTTTPSGTTTTTPSGTTTTTPSGTTTTPGSTVSGTKTTSPSSSSTSPGSTVLPTRFTNSPTSGSAAGDDTQVLGGPVTLPRTGANVIGAAAISLMLLLIGGLLLRLSTVRRRRTH